MKPGRREDVGAIDDQGTPRLLVLLASWMLGAAALLAANQIAMGLVPRPGVLLALACGLGVLFSVRRGQLSIATRMLCWGVTAAVFLGSFFWNGLENPVWALVPVAVMISGWLLGRREAALLALAGIVVILTHLILRKFGYQFGTAPPFFGYVVVLVISVIGATWISTATAATYRRQLRTITDSEEHLSAIIDSTDDMIWSVDATTLRLIRFNRGFSRFLQDRHGIEAAPGMGLEELALPVEAADCWAGYYRRAIQTGPFAVEHLADGGDLLLAASFNLIYREDQPVAVSVFAHNVTRQRRAENELRKLSQAVEQSPESVAITNLRTEFEYVNQAFVEASGFSREELIGHTPRLLATGKTPPSTYVSMWLALKGGMSWRGEFVNRRKDGSEHTDLATIAPLREGDGTITHYVAIMSDVTEQRRMAKELANHRAHLERKVEQRTAELSVAKRQAEEANSAKSAFLASMSHEIRTPINAILGLTHLLRHEASPRQLERIDKVAVSARHLLSLINNILDLSKIEAGKLQLDATDFEVRDVLADVRSLVEDAANDKGLVLSIDDGGQAPSLSGDVTRIRQCLLNYAGNAVKFTERGGVTLAARVLAEDGEGILVRFEVRDTGIGIAPERIDKLFNEFEQGEASTSRKFGGTGLARIFHDYLETRGLSYRGRGSKGERVF